MRIKPSMCTWFLHQDMPSCSFYCHAARFKLQRCRASQASTASNLQRLLHSHSRKLQLPHASLQVSRSSKFPCLVRQPCALPLQLISLLPVESSSQGCFICCCSLLCFTKLPLASNICCSTFLFCFLPCLAFAHAVNTPRYIIFCFNPPKPNKPPKTNFLACFCPPFSSIN